jgi:hypothetical protein
MCNQNRFLALTEENSQSGRCYQSYQSYKKSGTVEKQFIAPPPGFELCMNKSTKRAFKNGIVKVKTEGQLRTDAFETLGNKEMICQKLKNTNMCIYAIKGKKCPRKICYFAHSKDELELVKCFFGISCRHINDKTKLCKFIHPNETVDEYMDRIKQLNRSKDNVQVLQC